MGLQYGNEMQIDASACVICHRDTSGPGRVRVCPECKAEARADYYDPGDTTNFECRVNEAIPEGPKQ